MIDVLRNIVEQQRLPALAALLLTIGLLVLQYYLLRTGRRTRGLAKNIEAEIEPWLREIRETHLRKFKPKAERSQMSEKE